MKAKELMIGDWVYDRILKGNTKIEKITANHIKCDFHEQDYPLTGFEPIPLTAEILEKNGFKKYGDTGWWLEDDYYGIQIYEWSDSIWVFKYESTEMNTPYEQRTFSYVHNLQHALRECGIDKEIVL